MKSRSRNARWAGALAISLVMARGVQAATTSTSAHPNRAGVPIALRLLSERSGSIRAVTPEGRDLVLELRRVNVLAANAQVTLTTAAGVEPIAVDGEVFVGRVEGDASSNVSVVARPSGLSGTVDVEGREYNLETTEGAVALRPNGVDVARRLASLSCAVGSSPAPGSGSGRGRVAPLRGRPATPFTLDWSTPLVCTVAIECDYALYLRHNSNASALVDHVLAAMGTVASIYSPDVNVTFEIVRLNIHAVAENPDPFGTSALSSTAVLGNFRTWEQTNLGSVRRRISLLLVGTNQSFGDGYGGRADPDGLASEALPSAVVATTANTSTGIAGTLVAHEFGHLHGAWHTFNCSYSYEGYLPGYPSGTLISLNSTTLGDRFEGGCCDLVCVCPDDCDHPVGQPLPPSCWTAECASNLGITGEMMGYPSGQNMHAAVRQRIREGAVAFLLQGAGLYPSSTCTAIELDWISPPGTPVEYDLRESSQPITASTFDLATRLGTGTPQLSGEQETKIVGVGGCSGRKYFALRWRDSRNFWSNTTYTSAGTPCGFCDDGFAPLPEQAGLTVVTPQPAKDEVTLRFDVPRGAQHVVLTLYDVAGRMVERPVQGPARAGRQLWTWRPGSAARSGVYFAHLRVDDVEISRSILIVQ